MDKKMTDFNGINNKQMTKLFDDMNTENDTKSTAQTQKTVENDDKMTENIKKIMSELEASNKKEMEQLNKKMSEKIETLSSAKPDDGSKKQDD